MAPSAEALQLSIAETALAVLKARLAMTRFPDQVPDGPWANGTDLEYMCGLVGYWKDSFDWRGQEAALNAYPSSRSSGTTSTCTTCTCRGKGHHPRHCR